MWSVRESDLWGRSVRPWESDYTGRGSAILGPVWQISRLNALLCPGESDRHRNRSASHFGLPQPNRLASQIGLPNSDSKICEANLWGRGTLWLAQTDHMRNSGRPRRWEAVGSQIWEAKVGGQSGRPNSGLLSQSESQNSASHLGLPIWEADLWGRSKIPPENLTFDSNSTSDRNQMC